MISTLLLAVTLTAPIGKAGLQNVERADSGPEQACSLVQRPNWMITTRRAPPLTERCDG